MVHSLKGRPPLLNLDTVCAVAREGSFSAAAELENVTHGAISRRVKSVENWLGVPLFERHGRGVRLTPDGQRFTSRLDHAFSIIDDAAEQWHGTSGARIVKLSVLPSFARLWLFERLHDLEAGSPELRVQLTVESRNADITAGDVDLAIRYGHGVWPNVESSLFLPEQLYPVAHRDIASKMTCADSRLMLDFPLLHDSDLTGWRTWFGEQGIPLKLRPQDRRFEDYSLVLAAAEARLGIALARTSVAEGWLSKSNLVRLGRIEVKSPLAYYFVTARRESRPQVLALMERIRAHTIVKAQAV